MTHHPLAAVLGLAALGLAALGLAACDDKGAGMAANSRICPDWKAAPAAGAVADGPAAVDECVRRWAYTLAPSRDDADAVAEAVATACVAPLQRWNQQALATPAGDAPSASIITGEPTTPIAEHNAFANDRALFHVVQARAGRCAPPPVTKAGTPEGVG